jgi:hypothetical protein
MIRSLIAGCLMASGCFLFPLIGRTAADNPVYIEVDKAPPDYAIQGEYLGKVRTDEGEHAWGAQIIALGQNRFHGVGFRGGLPGDGWSRGDDQVEFDGEAVTGGAEFEHEGIKIQIHDGALHVISPENQEIGTLKKVERHSPTLGAKPPAGAIVLFDGSSPDQFENGRMMLDHLLAADCSSKAKFSDHKLHIEFRTPFEPDARGQARGNSGVYLQSRYEVQVLDSFGLEGKNNECGGIYSVAEPRVNMCFPPLTWQTYDVDFTAARYDDQGKKTQNARATIRHNGVVIHDNIELKGTPGRLPEGPSLEGLYLQGHGDIVVYRNIWVVPK